MTNMELTPRPLAPAARKARRLGVFGGSFDPPHAGHAYVARVARAAFELDHVVFVPASRPPHKPERVLAPEAERLRLLELLTEAVPWASIWDVELAREGPSYTVDTLRELRARVSPDAELFLLIGADNLVGLATWKAAEEVLALAQPIVVCRRGHALELPEAEFSPSARERLRAGLLAVEPFEASSSELRSRLAAGAELDPDWLPRSVWEYIRARGIYGDE